MKIAVNASYAASEMPTGVGNYIINLVKHLPEAGPAHQYFLGYRFRIKNNYINFNLPDFRFEPGLVFLSRIKPDVFHDPSGKYIKFKNSRNIITVHDAVTALEEDYTSADFKRTQGPKLEKALKRADKIIAVSDFTKREIIRIFKTKSSKITVVHHGVNRDIFRPEKKDTAFSRKYNIRGKYLLFAGNIEKRKNIFNIIRSFEAVLKQDGNLFLVLIGKNGYGGEEIRRFINISPAKNNIIQMDYVPHEDLPLFYQNAELFLFPSFYEGFGLPVLEAMACGCPVITSRTSSLPEAGGDAALYVSPDNIEEIAEAVLHLVNNPQKARELVKKGLSHSEKFTWQKCAAETLKVYSS